MPAVLSLHSWCKKNMGVKCVSVFISEPLRRFALQANHADRVLRHGFRVTE